MKLLHKTKNSFEAEKKLKHFRVSNKGYMEVVVKLLSYQGW